MRRGGYLVEPLELSTPRILREDCGRLGDGERPSGRDHLNVVDLGVVRVARGIKRPVQPELRELRSGDLSGAGAQQAVDADVLGFSARMRVVCKPADGDAVRRRAVAT